MRTGRGEFEVPTTDQQDVIPFGLPVILRSGREGVQIEGKDCGWSSSDCEYREGGRN